jgi:hypothetical protein
MGCRSCELDRNFFDSHYARSCGAYRDPTSCVGPEAQAVLDEEICNFKGQSHCPLTSERASDATGAPTPTGMCSVFVCLVITIKSGSLHFTWDLCASQCRVIAVYLTLCTIEHSTLGDMYTVFMITTINLWCVYTM